DARAVRERVRARVGQSIGRAMRRETANGCVRLHGLTVLRRVYAMGSLQGKVVLVTGGARRVGAAIARRAHAEGATLMLHHRSSVSEARKLQSELNKVRDNSVSLLQGDLLDTAKLPHLIAHTM